MGPQGAMAGLTFRARPGLKATLFLDEAERHEGRSLAPIVLDLAREAGVRTVLVTRGTAGFGHRRVIQTTVIEVLTAHLPIVIECIDEPERIERLVDKLTDILTGGLLEVQRTTLVAPG